MHRMRLLFLRGRSGRVAPCRRRRGAARPRSRTARPHVQRRRPSPHMTSSWPAICSKGRGPGTRGDQLAMEYIAAQFRSARPQAGRRQWHVLPEGLAHRRGDGPGQDDAFRLTKDGAPGDRSAQAPRAVRRRRRDPGARQQHRSQRASTRSSSSWATASSRPELQVERLQGTSTRRGRRWVMLVDDPPANAAEPESLQRARPARTTGVGRTNMRSAVRRGADAVLLIHNERRGGISVERRAPTPGAASIRISAAVRMIRRLEVLGMAHRRRREAALQGPRGRISTL